MKFDCKILERQNRFININGGEAKLNTSQAYRITIAKCKQEPLDDEFTELNDNPADELNLFFPRGV